MAVAYAQRSVSPAPAAAPARRPSAPPKPASSLLPATTPALRWSKGTVQTNSLKVSSPSDPAEKEAASTARTITTMNLPASPGGVRAGGGTSGVFRQVKLHRCAAPSILIRKRRAEEVQCKGEGPGTTASNVSADIQASMAGGSPLPLSVRRFMEPRFRADFGGVRIHTSEKAAQLNRQLSAQAFATGSHIFFGRGRFNPESRDGKELIAHELTHTIQQGAAQQDAPVQRSEDINIGERTAPQVQREEEEGDEGTVLSHFAEKANLIPGFRMFTIVLGVNPISMSKVARSAANILRALIELLPMGGLITQALDSSGVFDKAGAFVEQQIATLGVTGDSIKQAIKTFISEFSLWDLARPWKLWEKAQRIFTEPINRIIDFATGLVGGIVDLVKDAILRPIGKLAEGTEGYALLKAVLGKDPITDDQVPQTAEAIIGPFLKLIGQDEIWQNMQQSGAIPRAFAWFKTALGELMGFVNEIPDLFIAAFKSLELVDVIAIPLAFGKLAKVFGGFLGRFTSWVGDKIWKLLEIIFDVVSPGAFGYVKKTGAALKSILKNPLPFVGNLVKAAKLGFQNFASNFGAHLKAGLINWLTGSLPGVYIPKAFSLAELVKFVLSVLGISWANVRQKLVKVIGEPAVKAMEVGFDIVVTLVKDGPAAAWDKIKEHLSNLQDSVVGGIISMVVEMVVTRAVPKLIAMFIPGAGFISAIISIYGTVSTFVQELARIGQVIAAFISSIVAIANGAIGVAASKVESVLAGLLSLAISLLAGFAGFGKVADKVKGVINKVRATIDKGLDALIAWIVKMGKTLFTKVFGKDKKNKKPSDMTSEERLEAGMSAGKKHLADANVTVESLRERLLGIQNQFRLKSLTLVIDGENEEEFTAHVHGENSPGKDTDRKKVPKSAKTTLVGPFTIPRDRMKWKSKTKIELAKRFLAARGPASAVEASTGKIRTKKKYGRRHIVSFADTKTHYEAAFPPKTVEKACEVLTKFGVDAKYTKKSVHSKVKSLCRQAFNFVDNLWIGLQSENSALQAQVDPSPEMLDNANEVVQKKLDVHIKSFLVKWGVPGTPFGITTEAGEIQWEIQEV